MTFISFSEAYALFGNKNYKFNSLFTKEMKKYISNITK